MDVIADTFSVAIFRNHPAEGWASMQRYAEELVKALRHIAPGLDIKPRIPPSPWPLPRGMLLRRVLHYPVWARNQQGEVNHVLDHSYGHLLFGIDPERTIVTVHDIAPLLFPGRRLGLSGLAWRLAWRGTLRAARLIAVSGFTRRTLLERFRLPPESIVAIHEAVGSHFRILSDAELDDARTHLEVPEGPILLHVGNTQPRKNLEGVIRALSLLRSRGLDVTLVQAGGTLTEEQWRLVESCQLERHVLALGPVSEPALVGLYNMADVLVFPSFYEGFGFPVLEAMACGTPVVAGEAASLPEVVGDAGLLVDPRRPEDISQAVAYVLTDASLAAEFRHRGLERARQFAWSRTAEQTADVYKALVDTRRRGP